MSKDFDKMLADLEIIIEKYKQPKEPSKPEKEIIEVSEPFVVNNISYGHIPVLGKNYESYAITCSKNIPVEKLPAIKQAIEQVLNDDKETLDAYARMMSTHLVPKVYTEKDLEDAFNAGRHNYLNPDFMFHYPTFQDYITAKQKETV